MKKTNINNMDDNAFKDLAHTVCDWYEELQGNVTPQDAMDLAEKLCAIIEYEDDDEDGEV